MTFEPDTPAPLEATPSTAPVPPWEAELAAQALAEAHARDTAARDELKPQKLAERVALIENADMELARLRQDSDLWTRMSSRWRWSGSNLFGLLYALARTTRRPQWLLVAIVLFCIALGLATCALKSWVAGIAGP